ncbi:hypothetical protein Q5752_000453 [Cryptotrichosporon argae]
MSLYARENDALHANPIQSGIPQALTTRGSDWLWAVFAVMLLSDLVVFAWQFSFPRGQRVFHQLGLIILTTATIAYFSMASNLGYTGIATEFNHWTAAGTLRQVWYVRYIDWIITTPALLLELVLASGLPLSDIITLAFFDIVMIVTGLVGALVVSSYKWGFYAMGCAALFYIWWVLLHPARASANVIGADFGRSFLMSTGILSFLWLLYPIAWGLADGGNVLGTDGEMIFYGILDVMAKPVFLFIHLFSLSKLDLSLLQLSSSKYSVGVGAINPYDAEKASGRTPGGGVTSQAANSVAGTYQRSNAGPSTAGGKKLFSRKGQHDETGAAGTGVATGATADTQPRLSQQTAVSQ